MNKTLIVIMVLGGMVAAPAVQAASPPTPKGPDCAKVENLAGPTALAVADNGLTIELTVTERNADGEPMAFTYQATAGSIAGLYVKAGVDVSVGDLSGTYSQPTRHAISHVVFCGDPGDGGGDDPYAG
jgi:hypothetical protein